MSKTLLFVDDDEMVRTGLGADLEREGFHMLYAGSADDALDLLPAHPVSAVLLDIYMDGMDGIELLKEIRERWPLLPVVIITGHGSMSTVMEALHYGASDYLLKPCQAEVVAHRLHAVMEKQEAVELAGRARFWREKLVDLQSFAAGLAHDLNNHLTVMISSCQEALRQAPAGNPVRDELHWIQYSAGSVEKLANKLMSYSGRDELSIEPIDLSAFLPPVIERLKEHLHTRIAGHIEIDFHMPDSIPPLESDPQALEQAVRQLLLNAGEALVNREGVITVTAYERAVRSPLYAPCPQAPVIMPGDYVCIEVRDTAGGMDSDTLCRIFDPFFSTKFPGRGLGLPSAQSLMMAEGGGVHIHTDKGVGTTAMIFLPRSTRKARPVTPEGAPPPEEEHAPGVAAEPSVARVLIVEDEEVLRLSMQRVLKRAGIEAFTARDGREALDAFKSRRRMIDLVLLDMTLPDIRGDSVMAHMRRDKPSVKILLTSGFSGEKIVAEFSEDNRPDAFIQKPFRPNDVVQRVKEMLA